MFDFFWDWVGLWWWISVFDFCVLWLIFWLLVDWVIWGGWFCWFWCWRWWWYLLVVCEVVCVLWFYWLYCVLRGIFYVECCIVWWDWLCWLMIVCLRLRLGCWSGDIGWILWGVIDVWCVVCWLGDWFWLLCCCVVIWVVVWVVSVG